MLTLNKQSLLIVYYYDLLLYSYSDFEQAKEMLATFANFEQVKNVGHFANFG